MFPLHRERMRKPNPRGPKMRIHHRRFRKIASRLRDLINTQIVHPDTEPARWLVGLLVREIVCQEKEFVLLFEFVETAEVCG
jgi:hypothetical protein